MSWSSVSVKVQPRPKDLRSSVPWVTPVSAFQGNCQVFKTTWISIFRSLSQWEKSNSKLLNLVHLNISINVSTISFEVLLVNPHILLTMTHDFEFHNNILRIMIDYDLKNSEISNTFCGSPIEKDATYIWFLIQSQF